MDEQFAADTVVATETIDDPVVESTSSEYLGRWNRLVSTTNWEKGHIICESRRGPGRPPAPRRSHYIATRHGAAAWQRHAATRRPPAPRLAAVRAKIREAVYAAFLEPLPGRTGYRRNAEECGWKRAVRTTGWSNLPRCSKQRVSSLVGGAGRTEPPAESPRHRSARRRRRHGRPPTAAGNFFFAGRSPRPGRRRRRCGPCRRRRLGRGGRLAGSDRRGRRPPGPGPFEGLPSLPADLRDACEAFKLAIIHHRSAGVGGNLLQPGVGRFECPSRLCPKAR